MTKTEQARAFLDAINETNSQLIYSWEVNRWLHEAEVRLFNEIFWPLEKARTTLEMPPFAFESSRVTAECLRAFQKAPVLTTTATGYLSCPADLFRLNEMFALIDPTCGTSQDNLVAVQWQQLQQLGNRQRNSLAGPVWDDKLSPERYRVFYFNETAPYPGAVPTGQPAVAQQLGYRLLPRRQYTVQLRYLFAPPPGAVEAFPSEAQFAGNPDYQGAVADIQSLMPAFLHQTIVQWAVMLYNKALPDLGQYQAESAKLTPPTLP
jgi:hypothetical protein